METSSTAPTLRSPRAWSMHDGILLVGSHESDAGDVFRSTDGGHVWHNAHMISNGSNALLSHPSGIYLGTYVDGLHRSTDGGLTWQPVGGGFPASADVEALAASGSAIFVAGGCLRRPVGSTLR